MCFWHITTCFVVEGHICERVAREFEQYIDATKWGCFILEDLMNEGTKN